MDILNSLIISTRDTVKTVIMHQLTGSSLALFGVYLLTERDFMVVRQSVERMPHGSESSVGFNIVLFGLMSFLEGFRSR